MKKVHINVSFFAILATIISIFSIITCFRISAKAADVPITLTSVSRPSEIDTYKNSDQGIIIKSVKGEKTTIYSFTIPERGWLILDRTVTPIVSWSYNPFRLCMNSSMTAIVDCNKVIDIADRSYRYLYYLDPGTYYMQNREGLYETSITFGFFLPNSSVVSHTLEKATDNSYYTDSVIFVPHIGTTKLLSTIIKTSDINNSNMWNAASTNATDKYTVSKNGEYTIKAVFADAEWKDFPVMYSFSVYDIVPPPEIPKCPTYKVATNGKKAFKVSWQMVTNSKGYELQYSLDKKYKKSKTKTITIKASKNFANVKKLKSKKTYYVRMRSFTFHEGKKLYSSWGKTKNIKTK